MSNCGKSGCKEEPLAAEEEERVSFLIFFLHSFTLLIFSPKQGFKSIFTPYHRHNLDLFSGNSVFLQW